MEFSMYQHLRHRSSGQTGLLVHLRFVPGADTPHTFPNAGGGGTSTTTSWVAAAAAAAGGVGGVGAADCVSHSSLLLLLLLLLQCFDLSVSTTTGLHVGLQVRV